MGWNGDNSISHRSVARCKQFWHAGDYDTAADDPNRVNADTLDRARTHPKFLHSNATSHKWPLGAIAELLDNSYDEIVNGCKTIQVDIVYSSRETPMLSVTDDGGGMDRTSLHRMLSFGMSNADSRRIGRYGNGFKSSSMRLGADALVMSMRENGETAVGLLSYTFLRETRKEDVVVPIVGWDAKGGAIAAHTAQRAEAMSAILKWGPFDTEREVLAELELLRPHGTRVLIDNLWETDDGMLELDLSDPSDVRTRRPEEETRLGAVLDKRQEYASAIAEKYYGWKHSLRKYIAILYRSHPQGLRIILRGEQARLRPHAQPLP